MVTVRNKKNGSTSEMSQQAWKELQANPRYTGVFKEVKQKEVEEPEEVRKLKKVKAEKPKEETQPAVTEQPSTDIDANGK